MAFRTITGNIKDVTGTATPGATIEVTPVSFVYGTTASEVVLADSFTVTADGSGDVSFTAHEGIYTGSVQTSKGVQRFNLVVDSEGPWTLGRLVGLASQFTPGLAALIFDAATASETNAELSQAWAESPAPPDPGDPDSRSAKAIAETLGTLSELEALAERGETAESGAVTAQGLAESARDAAFVNAEVYADTAAGLAGTSDGDQFQVVEDDEIVRYRNDDGAAAEVARYPARAFLNGLVRAGGALRYPVAHEDGIVVAGYDDSGAYRAARAIINDLTAAGAQWIEIDHPDFVFAIASTDGIILAGLTHDGDWLPGGGGGGDAPASQVVSEVWVEPWTDPSENLLVSWVSDSETARAMEYRLDGSTVWQAAGSIRSRPFPALSGVHVHTVLLTGLSFASVYHLRWPGAAKTERLRTCPRRGLKAAVISDFQSSDYSGTAAQIGQLATALAPDLMLIPGDHVSDDGIVEEWSSNRWRGYFEMLSTYRAQGDALMPMALVIGNHEGMRITGIGAAEHEGNGTPGQIVDLCSWSYYEDHPTRFANSAATFSIGSELFVIGVETDHTVPFPGAQTDWLIQQVAEAYPKFRQILIMGHAPAFYGTGGARHTRGSQPRNLRNNIYPALADYADKITCYMCGHTHIFAVTDRFQVDFDDQLSLADNDERWFVDADNGIRQLGTGPVQVSGRALNIVSDQSVIDGSEMFIAAVGIDSGVMQYHGSLLHQPDIVQHFWFLEFDNHDFTATGIGADGETLFQTAETLPAYQE